MSFLKKTLAGIGIGNMKIDTILDFQEVEAGEEITGRIEITGGNASQELRGINILLMSQFHTEDGEEHVITLENYRIVDGTIVEPKEELTVDFSIPIPNDTPVSFGNSTTWLRTEADVAQAVDPEDNDEIIIAPHALQATVMEGIESLGFSLRQAEFEYAPPSLGGRLDFAQELEFAPNSNSIFARKMDELEVVFIMDAHSIKVYFEIDKKGNWLEERMGLDETKMMLDLPYGQSFTAHDVSEFLLNQL
ncbi:sporulation protein [Algivirga pacifica]|uniref:Sporulation protein n=1 Tax=Algivirga pacifica TaxID=1162670 RepID=A0ABP9D0V4_9BACT